MPNRLAAETSPYLLQHAHNPVDWYPWGNEAFARARAEDKPVLLSVGYSACHWCHVMERESFEDPNIARLMNENFINIKVDREERPDVDEVYMTAVQALTGRGGWPMTVFLTPDGRPFWGGTYFPPEDRHGMPGFPRVLESIARTYREQRGEVDQQAGRLTEQLRGARDFHAEGDLTPELLDHAARALAREFDHQNGGFGGAPKFPAAMALDFLLRQWKRTGDARDLAMVELSLDKMARGGIYDHLGGGFHRYSVDAVWLVPHFEKMLYDNALLARVYLHAWQATGKPFYRRAVEETLDYVLRDMTDPAGGFYSTQDADSEGVEGKFYVWTPAEIAAVIGPEAARVFDAYYGVSEGGNFEGANILNVARGPEAVAAELGISMEALAASLDASRRALLAARERRIHPARDEKVLTAWNGLMLRTLAEAAAVLDRDDYRDAAVRNAGFLTSVMMAGGRLMRSWKPAAGNLLMRDKATAESEGHPALHSDQARIPGFLEDYALLAGALITVHELTFDARWLEIARDLADAMLDRFWDPDTRAFYNTARDAETLIVRPRDVLDNATPSGNSTAVMALLRLGVLLDREDYTAVATSVLASLRDAMARFPSAFGELLAALDFALATPTEIAIIGDRRAAGTRALLREVEQRYLPNAVVAGRPPGDERIMSLSPLFEGRGQIDGLATAYVCENYACRAPTTEPAELATQLAAAG